MLISITGLRRDMFGWPLLPVVARGELLSEFVLSPRVSASKLSLSFASVHYAAATCCVVRMLEFPWTSARYYVHTFGNYATASSESLKLSPIRDCFWNNSY